MNKPIKSSGLRWLWLTVLVIVLDLGSKQLIMNHFFLGESLSVIPFFNFTYAQNPGAAFSFLADSGGWQRWLFSGIAVLICILLAVLMYRSRWQKMLSNCAYALFIGGALGNLFDRMVHGVVIDFIHFHVNEWSFPIFNIADCAITIGAILVIIDSLFYNRPPEKEG